MLVMYVEASLFPSRGLAGIVNNYTLWLIASNEAQFTDKSSLFFKPVSDIVHFFPTMRMVERVEKWADNIFVDLSL